VVRRSSLIKGASVVAVSAVIATVAVIAEGFDVAQTPVNDSAVWALQAGEGNRYARVNTELRELDTVKNVQNPSDIVQTASTTLLLLERHGRIVTVDPSRPQDYTGDLTELSETPGGTSTVVTTGPYIGYLTENGRVYAGRVDDGADASTLQVDPYAEENAQPGAEKRNFVADSIAIGTNGTLYAYSAAEAVVLRFDLTTGNQLGFDTVADAPARGTSITVVGSRWVLLSADGATLWISGNDPVDTGLTDDAVLQRPTGDGSAVYVASRTGLTSFALGDGESTTEVEQAGAIGIPAAPTALGGVVFAAWLSENASSGLLWSSAEGESDLSYGGQELGAEPVPVLRTNGVQMILNDTESGWVWAVPDGELVPSSQDWSIVSANRDDANEEDEQAPVVTERKPPVAEDDVFGVRAGQLVTLPVLLNDHDPNEDVLTIDPASVTGLDPSFGVLSVTNNMQDLAVQVLPGASGTVTFQYAVTDGTQADGLLSNAATVTLTVYDSSINNPPVWCGVGECQRDWPVLQVQPGSAGNVDVLRGWVDPEGDPIYVASAVLAGDLGNVASTPDGRVLFQHPDESLPGGSGEITVSVSDIIGAYTEKALTVEVTATPSITVEPFAITGTVGEPLLISPAKYIRGVAGAYSIVSADTESEDGSTTVIDNGGRSFTFTAGAAGNYFISYTVRDDLSELISTVRVQVFERDAQPLSIAPITVFVRPNVDATIDVFPSVTNPSKRVLMLSEALPEPIGANVLEVDIVNQELLRIKGSTADGQAGVLGKVRYTVSDGTGNGLYTAYGQATVILLPVLAAQAPIAVADAVTVRAGAQIDIPVLDNDMAPDGNTLVLNPDGLNWDRDEGLAFVSGRSVRLLAPETPGDYEASYTVYTAGSPEVAAKAIIRITVLPAGENRAPAPRTLFGRVLSGSTVSIPFDSFGVDPDGDDVRLDRVVSQPESGSAAIAATGDAIVYTSVTGFAGPVEFEYSAVDSAGGEGTAFVRVGVLDRESNPSPITYTDYVEVQAGANNTVTVKPASNDIDPAGKELEVSDIVPDAPAGTTEYDDLAALIGELDEAGEVTFTAGEVLGTRSFFYTVTNTTGDSSMGRIIIRVVREAVPDHPRVADTYVTLEDRPALANGIDVVSGKVTWQSGNVSDLELSLWNEDMGYTARGWQISGPLPNETVIVPFVLTGENALGAEVTTFGFLRIPGKNEVVIALRSGTPAQTVDENKSITFDLKDLVPISSGERLELDGEGVRTGGKRVNATCKVSGTEVTYAAGLGDPWVDYCAIPARFAGQSAYSMLVVRIEVIPEIPLPIMRSASVTHSPAAPEMTYDLTNMVTWAGKSDVDSLEFAIAYSGELFSVVQNGNLLTIYALDSATPGRENTVRVSLTSHPDVASAALQLKVGPAPTELPKGGTVAKECSQAGGTTSCTITVIGIPGEINIYRTPLVLHSVSVPASCTGVTMEVADASTVRASWTSDAPGGKCSASFVVKDPQGKLSPEDRKGTVLLDLQGYPKAPSLVRQSAYGDGKLKLEVTPGPAAVAYPALTGFTIYYGNSVVATCDSAGKCSEITGLVNGEQRDYHAFAVNAVGESKTSVQVTAWAYRVPTLPTLSAQTIFDSAATTAEGYLHLVINDTDPDISKFRVATTSEYNDEWARAGGGVTEGDIRLGVGTKTITVTPVSSIPVPTGTGATPGNVTITRNVAGVPVINADAITLASDATSITVNGATFNQNFSPDLEVHYIAYRAGSGMLSCSVDAGGAFSHNVIQGESSTSNVIDSLDSNKLYTVEICISNGFGFDRKLIGQIRPFDAPDAPTGWTYEIAETLSGSGTRVHSLLVSNVTGPAEPSGDFVHSVDISGEGPTTQVRVRYCHVDDASLCGDYGDAAPIDPNRAYQYPNVTVGIASCINGQLPGLSYPGTSVVSATVNDYEALFALDPDSEPDWHLTVGSVPAEATHVKDVFYELTYEANGSGATYLLSSTVTAQVACAP
jgi:hypothetical protein